MTIPVAEQAHAGGGVREALVATFRRVMRLYFRDIEWVGARPGSGVRGRVFVANHTNALIDPILIITGAGCAISPIAKSTLWDVPGLRWLLDRAGAVPIVRRVDAPDKAAAANADAFGQIAAHLGGGGNILIFPEGTSHSEPQLAPLRTGAARMLVAAAARGGEPPTFQAVGLEFDDRTDFRSRCLVLWGPVRRLADVAADAAAGAPGGASEAGAAGDADEARVQAITAQMAADLRDLLIEGETHDERRRIMRVAELLASNAGEHSLGAWSDAGRQVELANRTLRSVDAAVVARVAERVDAYYAELERLGLLDDQVTGAGPAPRAPEPAWQRAVLAPLAAAGFALYAIPYFLPRWFARSSDPDAVSTIKLGAALVVYPVWAAGLVTGALLLLPPPLSFAAAAVALASPFAALRWLDVWYQRTREPTPDELARLAELRRAACEAIDDARRRLPS
ncbi:MAG TPA: 1-acyl-sn-glycerol-3-phosphate acyltransferase [Kofleriaceae bacterium]|nr:1-acyl-sn-glycerol-3-phosphate acyltransferase [Kofleriaceae bacterium]